MKSSWIRYSGRYVERLFIDSLATFHKQLRAAFALRAIKAPMSRWRPLSHSIQVPWTAWLAGGQWDSQATLSTASSGRTTDEEGLSVSSP